MWRMLRERERGEMVACTAVSLRLLSIFSTFSTIVDQMK